MLVFVLDIFIKDELHVQLILYYTGSLSSVR